MRQAGIRETSASEPLTKCREFKGGIRTGWLRLRPGGAWRVPMYWPGGVRHIGGVNLICGFRRERGKAGGDMFQVLHGLDDRERPERQIREGLSTVAPSAGGPVRSSDDAR
jgi:hypothetical protein